MKESTVRSRRRYSYREVMKDIRSRMSESEKLTSEVIHTPFLETVSTLLEKTIARPTALLIGSIFAFVGVIGLYAYARFVGLGLSGSETIIIFALGWVIGTAVDLLRALFVRKS